MTDRFGGPFLFARQETNARLASMCNLYKMSKSADEVADFFSSITHDMRVAPGNAPEEIYPGYPGLVLTEGQVQQMTWGFPLALKGARGQPLKPKPVNNARSDKLGSPFWSASFRDRRCLVPVSEFAEARGPRGAKTRTWFSLSDAPLMAAAGFWRDTEEWGPAFTMVMTDAKEAVRPLHDRMPVILASGDWKTYLDIDPQAAFDLCRPYAGGMTVRHTDTPWLGRR